MSLARRLVIFLAAALVLAILACTEPEPMLGTVLGDGGQQAPAFELTDQFGQSASLAGYDGDVVLLTFLYTYCPDVCPAVTGHLRTTHELLGGDAEQVDFVAISLDPERDTVERAREYSEDWRMLDKWAFLVGGREQLASIWKSYYVDPLQAEWTRGEPTASPRTAGQTQSGVDALRREIATRYEVFHSTPVYLIDRDRRIRVIFTPPLDPESLAHDIRLLLE